MLRSASRISGPSLLCAVLAFGFVGAAPAQAATPAPTAAPAAAAGIGATAKNYVIGPGDVLDIFVWQNPDLSQKAVPVRPDGRISTPLIANIVAAGKTPVELAQDMDKALGAYIRSPRVTVIVSRAVGVLSQIQVIGQVTRPESIPYHEGMTVLDAVLAAGGLTPYAAGNRAKLERKVDGRVETLHLKLSNLINKGDLSQNLALQPGDVLVVPESLF